MAALQRWLKLAQGMLSQPTAALREVLPQQFIRDFVKARRGLSISEDASGNLLVKYPARGKPAAPLVLVAHLDHPGFWIENVSGSEVQLGFKGGVGEPHAAAGSGVAFFEMGRREPTGRGRLTKAGYARGRLVSATARITKGTAPAGGFAMWDFPGYSVKNGLIVARCCDDLLGAVAALCTLDEIARRKPKNVAVWGLFTRAEEVGFLGALESIRHKTIPKNACVLSLECSKALSNAPQGDGVIVRVGDKASIFDPELTEALRQAAEGVRKTDKNFKYQRKLMDGGSCEATVYCALGYRSSGLAVPLGNYHNQALGPRGRPGIGPESVKISDFECEVQLLTELALRPELLAKRKGKPPSWLRDRQTMARRTLPPTVVKGGDAMKQALRNLRFNHRWQL